MHDGRLSHDRANEIVSQNVSPDFFANELGCFASQDVHLEGDLDCAQIELIVPPFAVNIC